MRKEEHMKNKKKKRIFDIVIMLILIMILIGVYKIYKINDYSGYTKAESTPYTSEFSRDDKIKTSDYDSYKISSKEYNDALFYQTVSVKENTPYKVTAMIKTENIETENKSPNTGAQICISDTIEHSKVMTGTNEWQKIEFLFNSKNRTSIDIAFRLGGYDDKCKGTAWFSEFTIEEGKADEDNIWNFVCFVIENTDVTVNINGKDTNVKLSMTQEDKETMRQNMARFQKSCEELSGQNMKVNYDYIELKTPLTSLSYDEENGYYVAPKDVYLLLQKYLDEKEYDHIFVAVRLGDVLHQTDIQVNDWIGLGGMDYSGIGFSNIRLPNSDDSYIYRYDSKINLFPEEVFIHEFLHTLEKNLIEAGYTIPALHDYEQYGYQNQKLMGLKFWYQDYMQYNIPTQLGEKTGLNKEVYSMKPVHNSNFSQSIKLENVLTSSANLIEDAKNIYHSITQAFKNS